MFDNCDGSSCFWAMLGLMLLAAILGWLIGRIMGRNSASAEVKVDSSGEAKLSAELNALKGKYASLEKEHASLNTQYITLQGSAASSGDSSALSSLKAELSAFEGKYASLQHDYDELGKKYAGLQANSSSSTDDSAYKVRIQELEGEIKSLKASASAPRSNAAEERKRKQAEMLAALSAQRGVIDLGRIGGGSPEDKDNLKRLPGLGALLEKKLNALGIFKFIQMANLTDDDQAKLNGILDLPKEKFQKAGWVLESKRLAGLITEEEMILTRVKGRKSWLNYDRFGLASITEKDDLQKINGIGPFIEDKLNALEIYTFSQLSKLTKRDVSLVNDAIELNEGHIERDDWVGQSKSFTKKK
ncbi:MAG: hypothetical protein AAF696_31800 [Bacteroidota bacterium]